MKLEKTPGGYALYKEKTIIGTCQARPTEQGADITALTIVPEWRRKGYGSYLLKEVLRSFGGYDREAATVFTAPLPENAAERAGALLFAATNAMRLAGVDAEEALTFASGRFRQELLQKTEDSDEQERPATV